MIGSFDVYEEKLYKPGKSVNNEGISTLTVEPDGVEYSMQGTACCLTLGISIKDNMI